MKYVVFILSLWLSVCSAASLQLDSKQIKEELNSRLFLTLHSQLKIMEEDKKPSTELKKNRDRIRLEMARWLSTVPEAYLDQTYKAGFAAYVVHDSTAAIQAWNKYLVATRYHSDEKRIKQEAEVNSFYKNWKDKLDLEKEQSSPRFADPIEMIPEKGVSPIRVPKKGKIKLKKNETKIESSPAARAAVANVQLLSQAENARSAGRYEQALHLFKLAQQIDPESQEVEEKIEEMEDVVQ